MFLHGDFFPCSRSTDPEIWRIILLSCLLAIVGCNPSDGPSGQSGPGGQSPNSSDARITLNDRNRLLVLLKGQDDDGKLKTLMQIIQKDTDPVMRREALSYLAGLESQATPLSEPLTQVLLAESDMSIVHDIQRVIAGIGSGAEVFLVAASENSDKQQSLRIIQTLGLTGASNPTTLDFLRKQLSSKDSSTVIATCKSIEQIGKSAQSMLPGLIAILGRPRIELVSEENAREFRESRDSVDACVRAVASVGADESAVPALIDCLEMEANIAEAAAEALRQVGPRAQAALPALRKLQNRDDYTGKDIKTRIAREAAAKAILAISEDEN